MVRTPITIAWALAVGLVASAPLPAAAAPYRGAAIFPSASDRDEALRDFYRAWKNLYVVQACGEGRYLVKVDADGKRVGGGTQAGTITVSEAHGYGMLLTVMMADVDPEARVVFDGMVRYFHDHPATSDPGLMAWNQVADCSDASKVGGGNSATDGDLDIAYALLLAEKKWGRGGAFDYGAEARKVLAAILAHEVKGDVLLIGDWAKTGEDGAYSATTRASDFMVSHFKAFADATGERRWLRIRDRIYDTIRTVGSRYAPRTGLMPDFIVDMPSRPKPAPSGFLEGDNDGDYAWNSGRYPWRIALDYLLYAEPRAKAALAPLTAWARSATRGRPSAFADTYKLDGSPYSGHGTNSMAFVPMLGVAAMLEPGDQAWLDAIWSDTVETDLADEDYFGNTLKLLGMVAMSGHWRAP
ncbi:glycosyl hydrolase family 8 [Aureimonas sp. AU40]|uniref:glycosyl hydrolase family 8 n=1 Tax=Aureimonas sp. AU40 TaxID=1637747 RepID=UPI00078458FF|nr:glycosyl hydrolase family 8 [Aureimonas sp. AU40]